MNEKNPIPSTMDAAGWMALPVGMMWAGSFLCTMYGMERPTLSLFSTILGVGSIFMLSRQLTNFRHHFPQASWLHVMRLAFVTCLLAGLLTDAVQYAYFAWLDGGRLLSLLSAAFESTEYREALQKIMPEANLDEVREMMQKLTLRDIMTQLVFYNIILALPVSLLAALPVGKPKGSGKAPNTQTD